MRERSAAGAAFSLAVMHHADRAVTARIQGDIDIAAAPTIESQLLACIARGAPVLAIDVTAATCIDSTALTMLLRIQKLLDEQAGALFIVSTDKRINRVFEITGLARVLSIVERNPLADTPLAS